MMLSRCCIKYVLVCSCMFLYNFFISLHYMKTNTLHIKNPSEKLLQFVRKLAADKEATKKELREKAHLYFPKKK